MQKMVRMMRRVKTICRLINKLLLYSWHFLVADEIEGSSYIVNCDTSNFGLTESWTSQGVFGKNRYR
jgi:hypothetical protein